MYINTNILYIYIYMYMYQIIVITVITIDTGYYWYLNIYIYNLESCYETSRQNKKEENLDITKVLIFTAYFVTFFDILRY